jgi:hypothetical protein
VTKWNFWFANMLPFSMMLSLHYVTFYPGFGLKLY